MPNPIGVMFVLYIVVSIVSGIVSSVLKQSRPTARRRRPVHVPGPQIPYPAEVDVSELEEQPGPAADEGHADWTVIEEHVGSAVGEGDPHWTAVRGRLGPTVTGGYSGSAGWAITRIQRPSKDLDRWRRSSAFNLRASAKDGMRASRKGSPSRPGPCLATGSSSEL